ncbi:aspartate racemase, partial [Burkholderia sp. Ap-962]|nr:aspartate racemase [Burkholderia sp. Ap-962]
MRPRVSIRSVNMRTVAARALRGRGPEVREIGVLATSGTLGRGVYREALGAGGCAQIVPP